MGNTNSATELIGHCLEEKVRARLAPTPSGFLHWGNLMNFALTWGRTRRNEGELLLRIDDLDAQRVRPEYLDDIFETLAWLGFDWDKGPRSTEEFVRDYSQSLRTQEYRHWLEKFPGYACACSRQEVRSRTEMIYDGWCRDKKFPLAPGRTQCRLRADVPEHDVVLWRKEDLPSYHLVSLVEDLRSGVNLIVRGEDLRESSEIQKKLARMLGPLGERFLAAEFVHHPLLTDDFGHKLSKSDGADALKSWREQGRTPEEVFNELSRRAGWPAIKSLSEILDKGICA